MLLKGGCFALSLTFLDKATGLLPPGLQQQEKVSERTSMHQYFGTTCSFRCNVRQWGHPKQQLRHESNRRLNNQTIVRNISAASLVLCFFCLPVVSTVRVIILRRVQEKHLPVYMRRRRNIGEPVLKAPESFGLAELHLLRAEAFFQLVSSPREKMSTPRSKY